MKIGYQKYIKTSARVGYAPPVWKLTQVQGLKESRLTRRGDKENFLGDKNSISKNINTSARIGCDPPVWKQSQVQGLKEYRLTIREDEDRVLFPRGGLDKSRHIVPIALLVRVQFFRKVLPYVPPHK